LVQTTNRRREESLKDKELDFRKQGDRLKAQEQMLQDLRHRNSFLEDEVADRDAQIRQLETMLDEQQRAADDERQGLWERERQTREDASKCQGEVRAAARARAEMQEEVDKAREGARKSDRLADDLKNALMERDEEASELRQRVQGLLSRLDDAEEKMHRERKEAKVSKQGLVQLQQQIRDKENQSDESAERVMELRRNNEMLVSDNQDCVTVLRELLVKRLLDSSDLASVPVNSMELRELVREVGRRARPNGKAMQSEVVTTTKLWLEQLPRSVERIVDDAGEDVEDDGDQSPEAHRWRETQRRMTSAVSLLSSIPELRERLQEAEDELEATRSMSQAWKGSQSSQGAGRRSVTEQSTPTPATRRRAGSNRPKTEATASRRSTSGRVAPPRSSAGPTAASSRRRIGA